MSKDTGETMDEGEASDSVDESKVSPEFQKEVENLVGEATIPELEYITNKVDDMMKKLNSSQKKSGLMTDKFSTEEMPD